MLLRRRNTQVVFLVGFLTTSSLFAVTVGGRHSDKLSADEGGIAKIDPHPEVAPLIKATDVQRLGYLFSWPQRVVNQKFSVSLPEALTALSNDKLDSAKISKILTELYRTVNPKQVASIVSKASKLQQERDNGSETQVNSKSNLLLDSLVDTGKWLLGQDTGKNTTERKTLLKNFEKDWEVALKDNKALLDKRDEALNPNTTEKARSEASQALRNALSGDQIMSFINGQLKNGKEDEAVKWFKAVAWRVGDKIVADLKNNGQPISFYTGASDEEIAEGLRAYEKFSAKKGSPGLFALTLNQVRHTGPAQELFAKRGSDNNFQVIEGRPNGVPAPQFKDEDAFAVNSDKSVPPADTATQSQRKIRTVQ